jgi:fluoroquinolone transport system permease protein
LIFAIVMSVIPALLFVVTRDAMDAAALNAFGVAGISRYVAIVVLALPAVLIGWVTGFLLLEDRDDGVLLAVDVTQIGKSGFLTYRVTVTALVGAAITAIAVPFVAPALELPQRLLIVTAVAMESVLAAVILPALARNKVEGLALTKLTNIAAVVPLIAIVPSPWRYIAGIVPTYWLGELLAPHEPATPFWLIVLAVGITHAGCALLLFALLGRRVG